MRIIAPLTQNRNFLFECTRWSQIKLCGIEAPAKSPQKEQSRKNLQRLVDTAKGSVMVWKVEGELAEVFVSAPTAAQPEQEKFLNAEQLLAGLASPNKQICYN